MPASKAPINMTSESDFLRKVATSRCRSAVQRVSECLCQVEPRCGVPTAAACKPSVACSSSGAAPAFEYARHRASIVLSLGFNRSWVRPYDSKAPFAAYRFTIRRMVRLLLSLRNVNTTLPVHVMAQGERHSEHEALLALLGARFIHHAPALPWPIPAWISPNHRGTWYKLGVLGLTHFDRIVLLDNDCITLRNIDHLSFSAAPAFVFISGQLNSGVAVLAPLASEHGRMRRLVSEGAYLAANARPTALKNSPGHSYFSDQLVWQNFYSGPHRGFHELPTKYMHARARPHRGFHELPIKYMHARARSHVEG